MAQDFIVRPYFPGDEEEIVKLLELVFTGWPHFDLACIPLEHWRGKHQNNPFQTSFIAEALSIGRIIGANQSLPTRIKIGDGIILCVFSANTVVHPDFMGKGIYSKIDEMNISIMNNTGIQLDYFTGAMIRSKEDAFRGIFQASD